MTGMNPAVLGGSGTRDRIFGDEVSAPAIPAPGWKSVKPTEERIVPEEEADPAATKNHLQTAEEISPGSGKDSPRGSP